MRENILNSIYEIFNKETNAIINIDNMKLLYNTQKYTKNILANLRVNFFIL